MSHEEIIREQLAGTLQDLGGKLDSLRESLQALSQAVPSAPDVSALAAAVSASLPAPEPPPPPVAAPAAPAAASALNNALLFKLAMLEYPETQVDILKHFMEAVQDYASRGVLFIIKGDQAQCWSAFGFTADTRGWRADMANDPLLKTLSNGRSRLLLEETVPGFIPVSGSTRRCLLSPLLLKGKPAAFLYADSGENGLLDHYSIDILLRTTSLVIDILPLRAKREPLLPVMENQEIVLPGATPPPVVAQEESSLFEDTGTLAVETPESAPEEIPELVPEPVPEPEVLHFPPPPPPPMEMAEPVEEIVPEPVPEPVAFTEPLPVPAAPPPPPPPPAEAQLPPEEQKLHDNAKRFAKLLVQEIALYHPKEMAQGKANKNLYQLMRDDIDRSREAYDGRHGKDPSIKARDYFREALVKYLADGDASALGD